MAFVADNSVVVPWFVNNQANDYTRAMLRRSAGETVHVPAVWPAEFANVILSLTHRRSLKPAKVPGILGELEQMDIDTDQALPSVRALFDLGRRFALGAYDASYLELAMRMRLPLAACDGALRKAADRAGILLT